MNINKAEEIIEGNKLIAEFDGWYQKDLPKNGDINWFHEKYSTKLTNKLSIPAPPSYFKYHSSWDWLMPVVEKINKMAFDNIGEVGVVIYPGTTNIQTVNDELLIEGLSQTKYILNTWYTVIFFIKWYNQNKKQ